MLKTVSKPLSETAFGVVRRTEEQIPQIVGKTEKNAKRNERLGRELPRPKAGGPRTHLAHKVARPTLELLAFGSTIH